jgi:uncharacterized protein
VSGSINTGGHQYQIVEAYGPLRFRVSGTVHQTSVIVFPEETVTWPVESFASLVKGDFDAVIERAGDIEILLLGCGARMELVPRAFRDHLRASGVIIEPMDTGAAARTFNLLLSEDRKVSAALIVLPEETDTQ